MLLLAYKPITLQENILYINMHFICFIRCKLFNDTKLITRSALSIMNILCVSLSSFQRELRVDKLVKCDNVMPSCCNVVPLLERAEDSHSVFGN